MNSISDLYSVNPLQDREEGGGVKKAPRSNFFPVTSTNVGTSL